MEKQISSNLEEKPPAEQTPINVTSHSGGQLSTSSADEVSQSPTSILDFSVIMSHSGWSGPTEANILGGTAAAAGTSFLGEVRPPRTAKGSTDWYDMCTESLGFESLTEKMDVCNLPAEEEDVFNQSLTTRKSIFTTRSRTTTRSCGLMREKTESKDFPPPLTTLDLNRRPRFSYEKVRTDDGRLQIFMVERDTTEIIRTSSDEGGVLMKMVTNIFDEEDDEDDKNSIDKSKNDEQQQEVAAATRTSERENRLERLPAISDYTDLSGRPRFSYEKVRTDDGRLRIVMVVRDTPEIIRMTSSEEGGVVMKMVTSLAKEDNDQKNSIEKSKNEQQEPQQQQESATRTSGNLD
ncbi:hypothetical protein Ddye_016746 [Dipteronia dyeriana]|uniref:Uncharacterized protein n=1 Tax=Dipteronia dyeriana TaxID=168575 RepID=A0AAD9U882_9ROSI|nr:hypothetical protein Ddye_016746 [Dipteronia dyeriana]